MLLAEPQLTVQKLERTRRIMNEALPSALVTDYETHIQHLNLLDNDDRHVLAAAIHIGAQFIVTNNLRDFPASVLEPLGIEAIDPDAFVINLAENDFEGVLHAVAAQRENFKTPPLTRLKYLERLERQGLTGFVT